MNRRPDWPAKSLLLADAGSILAGFCLFRFLCSSWPAAEFARWEWLRVSLGLCLLLPRNGFDILAIRSAVRHPRSMRAWTALNLLVRLPLAFVAMGLFVAVVRWLEPESDHLAITLALSLPVQSLVPDLAARVQGRHHVAAIAILARTVIPVWFVCRFDSADLSPSSMARVIVLSETAVAAFWWVDAIRHGGLPGGRWRALGRRGGRAMMRRSFDQSLGRWIRVASWHADALLLAPLAPDFWARIAPVRALLMTAVFPLANYLGAVGPLLARESHMRVRDRLGHVVIASVALGSLATLLAFVRGPELVSIVIGSRPITDRTTLASLALRFAPVVIIQCAASFWTTLRRDDRARSLSIAHLSLGAGSILCGAFAGSAEAGYRLFVAAEWALAITCVTAFGLGRMTSGIRGLRIFVGVSQALYVPAAHFARMRRTSSRDTTRTGIAVEGAHDV